MALDSQARGAIFLWCVIVPSVATLLVIAGLFAFWAWVH